MWILTFRSDLAREEVSRWWRTSHGAIALRVPGIRRYVQNHLVPASGSPVGAGTGVDYQGVVECWFDDQVSFDACMATTEWADLEADGPAGLDMTRLQGGFVREHVLRWDGQPDGRIYSTTDVIPEPLAPGSAVPDPTPMLKAIWLVPFRDDVDHDEVRLRWRTTLGRAALEVPGVRRYVQNHILGALDEARAAAGIAFQGVVECWFDDHAAYQAATTSPEWDRLRTEESAVFRSDAVQSGLVREYLMRWEGLQLGPTLVSSDGSV